jgi:hypothetical protein
MPDDGEGVLLHPDTPEEEAVFRASYDEALRRYERHGGGPEDGSAGVRGPRRPSDGPPGLAAEADR